MDGVILMVEDDPADVELVRRQLQYSKLGHLLYAVPNGREAIDYLSGMGKYSDRELFPQPCLLILDLQMPGVDGFELIEWVRKDPHTRELPIIIYTASVSRDDAQRAYALGANAYFAKLTGPGQVNLLFTTIEEFCARGTESHTR
jgi:CheY-like chemotaxis protein